jgi:hypothetical protein
MSDLWGQDFSGQTRMIIALDSGTEVFDLNPGSSGFLIFLSESIAFSMSLNGKKFHISWHLHNK